MVSPRRSSRARSTAFTTHSSSSSGSARSRHSRHHENDPHTDFDFDFQRGRDKSQSAQLEDSGDTSNPADDDAMDANDGEDEITRCICGYLEYQGGDDDQSDTDGLFIQCDQCAVWQHGFCVGFTDSASTPENYYCEQCRPEFHRLTTSKSGMKTSVYLPSEDPPKSATSKESSHKRRTTMNSRDADYETEILNRVIEQSKEEAKVSGDTGRASSGRGKKRGTSEASDELKQELKRVRTSNSPDNQNASPADFPSDNKASKPSVSNKKRGGTNGKNSAVQNTSISKRSSTRNKNAEKYESRKEDSEHSDEYNSRKNSRTKNRSPVNDAPSLPPPNLEHVDPPQPPVKRSARNQHNNGGVGTRRRNNRQTRQSEDANELVAPAMARDHSSTGRSNAASFLEKPTKPRLPQARMSMNEMKKRVSSISEYITRTQIEIANTSESDVYAYLDYISIHGIPFSNTTTPQSNTSQTNTPTSGSNGVSNTKNVPSIQINGTNGITDILNKASEALSQNIPPGGMHSKAVGLMETISSKINRWQQSYGEKA